MGTGQIGDGGRMVEPVAGAMGDAAGEAQRAVDMLAAFGMAREDAHQGFLAATGLTQQHDSFALGQRQRKMFEQRAARAMTRHAQIGNAQKGCTLVGRRLFVREQRHGRSPSSRAAANRANRITSSKASAGKAAVHQAAI